MFQLNIKCYIPLTNHSFSFTQIVEDMDTLEETPIADISATYLTDEQFNNLYPKHPIDVSNYLLIMYLR